MINEVRVGIKYMGHWREWAVEKMLFIWFISIFWVDVLGATCTDLDNLQIIAYITILHI